ncbi:MAG: PAS domain-containing protein, partial [Mucilaginibacter polytrichastri]|nr:PAS domain-containing protein [Mucilaginibacter polytrichastri]
MNDPLFRAIFDQLPEPHIIVKASPADHEIVLANRAFENSVPDNERFITGKSLWEIFDEKHAGKEAIEAIKSGIAKAVSGGEVKKLPRFRFDISQKRGIKSVPRWWQIEISPVKEADGSVEFLVCATKNIVVQAENEAQAKTPDLQETTLLIEHDKLQQELNHTRDELDEARQTIISDRAKESTEDEYRLRRVFETTPMGLTIFRGEDLIIERANQPVLQIWGRTTEEVIGRKLMDVFPELEGQPFPDFLRSVRATGKTIAMPEIPVTVVMPDGKANNIY